MPPEPRQIVLTLDYEIFGNGTGDVRRHAIDPTEQMCRLGEACGVPLTIFFEVEEYVAFERQAPALRQALGYDPARLMREQLASLARRGHDLQLHLHPQWHGARYESGQWHLRPDHATVDSLFESQDETTRYLADRKAVVDEILGGARPGHRCTAYRAGGFCAQPGRKLLGALAANAIRIDSSVVVGMLQQGDGGNTDYRNAPAGRRLWRVGAEVAQETPLGRVLEVPIHSVLRRRYHQLTPGRLKAKFSSHVPRAKQREMIGELGLRWNPVALARFLVSPVPIKLDFHNLSPAALLRMIRHAPAPPAGEPDVLVAIGHSKEHRDDNPLRKFFLSLAADPGLKAITFGQLEKALRLEATDGPGSHQPAALRPSHGMHRPPRATC